MRLLKRHRIATGMTLSQVAKRVGVTVGAASGWENGTHGMTPKHLVKFARLLGMHPIALSKIIEPDEQELVASK